MAIRLIARIGVRELRHVLVAGEALLGTDPDCDFVLGEPTVSRRHARVVLADEGDGESVTVLDLDSRNGVEVDGRRVVEAQGLRPGRHFRLGDVEVRIESAAAGDARIAAPAMAREHAPAPPAADTIATGPLQGFLVSALPELLGLAAAGTSQSELASRAAIALVAHGCPSVQIRRARSGVLARAGENVDGACSCRRDALVILFATSDRHGEASLRPMVELVADLLELALRSARQPAQAVEARPAQEAAPSPASVDPVLRDLYRQAAVVARSRLTVLIEGESGTGKELFARYLHAAAGLAADRFVALNCAALPRDLLDAELFGIEAGVATGVSARAGRFEQAHDGSLFLDEIADMAPDTQARLLRVLQEGVVYRIGGDRPRPARARVISACNRPLSSLVAAGQFRLDLYHRITDWSARLPPLRERAGDIAMLAGHFLERECRQRGISHAGISRAALDALENHDWPGNVRELEREMMRIGLFLNDGEVVDSGLLRPELRSTLGSDDGDGRLDQQLAGYERRLIRTALAACEGNVVRAAERLGIGKSTLYRRLAALGIES
ncbi:MAG: sigma 54-interacting transcriptional regulator [Xanthomonadales bacterium]|nr:sigma 54-interacting transcriptional regulator [Xanthomonadales bacterium]